MIELIDKQYPYEQELIRWFILLLKPFLLSLFSESRYDYSTLVIEEAKRLYGVLDCDDTTDSQDGIVKISRDTLFKKFESKLKQLLTCFQQLNVKSIPSNVLDYLRVLLTNPKRDDLSLFEVTRLDFNLQTDTLESIQRPEEIMLLGLYLLGKILSIKLFLRPA